MADAVTFTVPGEPVPFAWRQRGGERFCPARQKRATDAIGLCARRAMAGRSLMDGPIEIDVVFIRHRRSRRRNQVAPWPDTARPDLTNLVKLLEDALTGIVWADDTQVVRQRAAKWATADPADTPKTIVTVRRIEP